MVAVHLTGSCDAGGRILGPRAFAERLPAVSLRIEGDGVEVSPAVIEQDQST
jgi:hypothetical protein